MDVAFATESSLDGPFAANDLLNAFRSPDRDAVSALTRKIAAAPGSQLEPLSQLKMLLRPVSLHAASEVPLLHLIATRLEGDAVGLPTGNDARCCVFDYMQEVAASRNLSVAFKTLLCSAIHGNPAISAARAALDNRQPGIAAAMMCGLLSGGGEGFQTQILLQYLSVAPQEVLAGLAECEDPDEAAWAALLGPLLQAFEVRNS